LPIARLTTCKAPRDKARRIPRPLDIGAVIDRSGLNLHLNLSSRCRVHYSYTLPFSRFEGSRLRAPAFGGGVGFEQDCDCADGEGPINLELALLRQHLLLKLVEIRAPRRFNVAVAGMVVFARHGA